MKNKRDRIGLRESNCTSDPSTGTQEKPTLTRLPETEAECRPIVLLDLADEPEISEIELQLVEAWLYGRIQALA